MGFRSIAALHHSGAAASAHSGARLGVKYFILLHFGGLLQSGESAVVQRTKIRLTVPYPLPRMVLLRRTTRAAWK
jgi:hypothetical protein